MARLEMNTGRDELNLAEFPLATLASRAPAGQKTLVFEDRIWDRGNHRPTARRLTVAASDKYGLPTALDDEVIFGLVQLTKAAEFASRNVQFSRYRLAQLLGWRDEGKSYQRLEESLKRWLGVTLYYENAWWDKRAQRWVDAHFHVLESIVLYRRRVGRSGSSRDDSKSSRSCFTWNEIVFHSFQAGNLKQIDVELYRSLTLPTAKRIYRFLDKRFHFSRRLQFDLCRFAQEHIGLSRTYDAAQLKRRLEPAIRELEAAGFLEPAEQGKRFLQVCRGTWQVVFVKRRMAKRRGTEREHSDLEERLTERGVTPGTAAKLVRGFAADLIFQKIAAFDRLISQRDKRVSRNPAGYLVQSIRDDYQSSEHQSRQLPRRTTTNPERCNHSRLKGNNAAVAEQTRSGPIQDYLNRLSVDERVELEHAALASAARLAAEGYRRAKTSGNAKLLDEYRAHIVERHVEGLLRLAATTA